jgi:hypothetical protein
VALIVLGGSALAGVAVRSDSYWGLWTCVAGVVLVVGAVGFRVPAGSPVAFAGVVATYVGGLWDNGLRGAIPVMAIVSLLGVLQTFWREDDSPPPDGLGDWPVTRTPKALGQVGYVTIAIGVTFLLIGALLDSLKLLVPGLMLLAIGSLLPEAAKERGSEPV